MARTRLLARLVPALASILAAGACATSGAGDVAATGGLVTSSDGSALAIGDVARDHDATVLVWWASTCPCVKRYEARVRELAARHQGDGVALYYVSSNADDGAEEIARAASSAPIPVVRDEGGELARHLGVISTPTVVVLDRQGRVRFHGWLDNEHAPGDPDRQAWLDDALPGIVAGAGEVVKTPTWGCMVTRSLGQVGRCHTPPKPLASP